MPTERKQYICTADIPSNIHTDRPLFIEGKIYTATAIGDLETETGIRLHRTSLINVRRFSSNLREVE